MCVCGCVGIGLRFFTFNVSTLIFTVVNTFGKEIVFDINNNNDCCAKKKIFNMI